MAGYTIIVVVLLLLTLISWIIFTPIIIDIDSDTSHYEVRQPGIIKVSLHPNPYSLTIKVFGFRIPIKGKRKDIVQKQKQKDKAQKKKKGFHRSSGAWRFLVIRGLKSFKMRRLWVDVDMDDVFINAQLIPITLFLSRGPVRISTNYYGHVSFQMLLEGRLNKLIWIFLRFLTKK